MTINTGFSGAVLHVDLTSGRTSRRSISSETARDFIGGLGLTFRLAVDAVTPGIDPLAPGNPILIGTGPLVGTGIPSSSRVYAVTKLPATNTIGWCGAGGMAFGCNLKYAGYDHIIITGKSDRPVYLDIVDDDVKLRDASGLWGKGVSGTIALIRQRTGGRGGIAAIGQAGENRVLFSMAYIDGVSTMGRGGLGAVMGAKNLKAIAVRGTGHVEVSDAARYKTLAAELAGTIRNYPYLKEWQQLGMLKSFPMVPPELYEKIKKRRIACVSCPFGCKDLVEIPDGPFCGHTASSSSVINLLMPIVYGFSDYREAIRLVSLLDEFGMDMFEFFGIMKFAAELFAQGILPANENDPPIVINSLSSMTAWAEKTAMRKGAGEELASGFAGLLTKYGDRAAACAPALVKNMHPYTGPDSALPWDLFGTMELGQITEPRGPHVGSGGSPTYFAKRPLDLFPRHLERMGVPKEAIPRILPANAGDKPGLNVGTLLAYSHRWFSTLGSLGICARAQVNRFYNLELCSALYQAVTGLPTTPEQLRLRAWRVWSLYKMLNVRENAGLNTDTVPQRWVTRPGFREYVSEEPLEQRQVQQMISAYYREQGWNVETGAPEPVTLKRLGLNSLFT